MEMSLAGYTHYPATLDIGSSILPIHFVAFSMVTSRWETYQVATQS
jgi:hypothetical protein